MEVQADAAARPADVPSRSAATAGAVVLGGSFQGFAARAANAASRGDRPSRSGRSRTCGTGSCRLWLPKGFHYRSFHDTETPVSLPDGTALPGVTTDGGVPRARARTSCWSGTTRVYGYRSWASPTSSGLGSHVRSTASGGVDRRIERAPTGKVVPRFCSATMAGPDEGCSGGTCTDRGGDERAGGGADRRAVRPGSRRTRPRTTGSPARGRLRLRWRADFTRLRGGPVRARERDGLARSAGTNRYPVRRRQLRLPHRALSILWREPEGHRADNGSACGRSGHAKNGVKVAEANAFNGANDYGDISGSDHLTRSVHPCARQDREGPDVRASRRTPSRTWSNDNNVFQFIRVEETAYDPTSVPARTGDVLHATQGARGRPRRPRPVA